LGGRGDAATALAEADYLINAATGTSANDPADVGGSYRTSTASSARTEPAAERAITKETVESRARAPGAPRTHDYDGSAIRP